MDKTPVIYNLELETFRDLLKLIDSCDKAKDFSRKYKISNGKGFSATIKSIEEKCEYIQFCLDGIYFNLKRLHSSDKKDNFSILLRKINKKYKEMSSEIYQKDYLDFIYCVGKVAKKLNPKTENSPSGAA